jgi:hypothetical protein
MDAATRSADVFDAAEKRGIDRVGFGEPCFLLIPELTPNRIHFDFAAIVRVGVATADTHTIQ